jgi:hypothetical protein
LSRRNQLVPEDLPARRREAAEAEAAEKRRRLAEARVQAAEEGQR